jgi:hypothetical protein
METKPASKRQLAYIRRLQTVVGESEPEKSEEMSHIDSPFFYFCLGKILTNCGS